MDSYVIISKLHDDVWFCSIFVHLKLMNSTLSAVGLPWHQPVTVVVSFLGTNFASINLHMFRYDFPQRRSSLLSSLMSIIEAESLFVNQFQKKQRWKEPIHRTIRGHMASLVAPSISFPFLSYLFNEGIKG